MNLPISNAYNNILIQCKPALPPHPEELYIMERHANESGIYIRSLDERLTLTAEVYKPGWATHLKKRSVSYTGAPTYLKYFIPIDNKQYGLLVEKLFKLITLEYRCYENTNSELRMMSFTSIVKLFEHICKYTAEQIECEIKRLSNERYIKPGVWSPYKPKVAELLRDWYLKTCETADDSNQIKVTDLWESFKSHCNEHSQDPKGFKKKYFLPFMEEKGHSISTDNHSVRFYTGIQWKEALFLV